MLYNFFSCQTWDNVAHFKEFACLLELSFGWLCLGACMRACRLTIRDELKRLGFPPTLPPPPEEELVRIGSIDLSGDICATLQSRPLKKEIAVIRLDMDSSLHDLDRDIRKRSEENLLQLGKRGCTPREVFDLIRTYVDRKSKQIVEGKMEMDTTNPSSSPSSSAPTTDSDQFVIEMFIEPSLVDQDNEDVSQSDMEPKRNVLHESSGLVVSTTRFLALRLAGKILAASRSTLEYSPQWSQTSRSRSPQTSTPHSGKSKNHGILGWRSAAAVEQKIKNAAGHRRRRPHVLKRLAHRFTTLFFRLRKLVRTLFLLTQMRPGSSSP
jgi:hypothetical protein